MLGISIILLGLICLGGGIALLAWRVLSPEEAVILPPHMLGTTEYTPTPGILSAPLLLPPMPDYAGQIALLPVSERPTPTLTPFAPTSLAVPTSHIPLLTPALTFDVQATVTAMITAPTLTTIPPSATAIPTRATTPYPTFESLPTNRPTLHPTDEPRLTDRPHPTATLIYSPTAVLTLSPTPTASPAPLIPEQIIIEEIGLDAPIVPVSQYLIQLGGQVYRQWEVPNQRAAGWHQLSAPLGVRGNTVLNGHHNVYGEVFRHLVRLEPGNLVTLTSGQQRYAYVVVQTMTLAESGQPVAVRQTNARWILPTTDERVTLITCWPYTANSHRLVVIAVSVATLDHLSGIP